MKIWGYRASPMFHKIKEGAIFVADAHVNEKREEFLEFLKALDNAKIIASQLFLMGDIFDLLVDGVGYTTKFYKEYITLINSISKKIETFYFEGNHDFNLELIFPKVRVFPRSKQPQVFSLGDKKVMLLHGDLATPTLYNLYTFIIRSKVTIFFLGLLDTLNGYKISKKILKNQLKKDICKEIDNFNAVIKKRFVKIDIDSLDIVMEGHFHQNISFEIKKDKKYINIPSFACNKSFIIVKSHLEFRVEQFTLFKRR